MMTSISWKREIEPRFLIELSLEPGLNPKAEGFKREGKGGGDRALERYNEALGCWRTGERGRGARFKPAWVMEGRL